MNFGPALAPEVPTLMASVHDTVLERIRREQIQFELDSSNWMNRKGLANCIGIDLAQANAADLALLDHFGQGLDQSLDRDVGVNPRHSKDIDSLSVSEYPGDLLDRRTDGLCAAGGIHLCAESAFDAEYDPVGVPRVRFEIVLYQLQRVFSGCTVLNALNSNQSTPLGTFTLDLRIGAIGGSSGRLLTPLQKFAPCSSTVFIAFAATGYSTGAHGTVKPIACNVSLASQCTYPHYLPINPYPTGPTVLPPTLLSGALPMPIAEE